MAERRVTCVAPVNIALIKYWGKRDEDLVLPINSSLSVTLDEDVMCSRTTAELSADFGDDLLVLNGKQEEFTHNKRFMNCLAAVREMAARQHAGAAADGESEWWQWKIQVRSVNNFPTAAGLASSASGFACLVATLVKLFQLKEEYVGQFTGLARLGSGSACRSLMGGFVKWNMGECKDGTDSVAEQVAPAAHWPELCMVVLVIHAGRKENPSTSGMKTSVETSELLKYRADVVVPARMTAIEEAIQAKDFTALAEISMKDSNQFHAVCADTFPPIRYMNESSMAVVALVHAWNKAAGRTVCGYSFDAGPNAVLLCERGELVTLMGLVQHFFCPEPEADMSEYVKGSQLLADVGGMAPESLPAAAAALDADLLKDIALEQRPGAVRYIILSKLGSGSKELPEAEAVTV